MGTPTAIVLAGNVAGGLTSTVGTVTVIVGACTASLPLVFKGIIIAAIGSGIALLGLGAGWLANKIGG